MAIITVKNLSKTYTSAFKKKNVVALDNISFDVNEGEIFGFLGPNGAGKTTFIKIMLGIVFPGSGDISMLGQRIDDYKIKSQIGYLPESHKFPGFFTAKQTLKYFGQLSGLSGNKLNHRIEELLELVGLKGKENLKVKTFSKGMVQRLGLAQAMINEPKLIFLDEPTDGVDPIGRKEIRDVLIKLKNSGITIFLNSHLLSEVEKISDTIAILNKGSLVKIGSLEESRGNTFNYNIKIDNPQSLPLPDFRTQINLVGIDSFSFKTGDLQELNSVIDILRAGGFLIKEIYSAKESLEEAFINLIQQDNSKGGV